MSKYRIVHGLDYAETNQDYTYIVAKVYEGDSSKLIGTIKLEVKDGDDGQPVVAMTTTGKLKALNDPEPTRIAIFDNEVS